MDSQTKSKAELSKKILILLISFYIVLDLVCNVVLHKLVSVGFWVINASAFCYPITYLFNDVITEVFGFSYGRLTVWIGIVADWVFIGLIIGLVSLSSPSNFHLSQQFHNVLDPMGRILFIEGPSILIARFVNIYLLSKSKILLNSRFFWIRSVASSCVGSVIHSTIDDSFIFFGVASYSTLSSIIILNSLVDIIVMVFFSWLPVLAVYFLKNKLGIDEFNVNEKFNLFAL